VPTEETHAEDVRLLRPPLEHRLEKLILDRRRESVDVAAEEAAREREAEEEAVAARRVDRGIE
jgi:hypothetical protein